MTDLESVRTTHRAGLAPLASEAFWALAGERTRIKALALLLDKGFSERDAAVAITDAAITIKGMIRRRGLTYLILGLLLAAVAMVYLAIDRGWSGRATALAYSLFSVGTIAAGYGCFRLVFPIGYRTESLLDLF